MTTKITTTPTPLAVVDKINSIIDDKLDKTGTAASATTLSGLTATVTELNYVDGVTSNIQTQLNGKLSTSGKAASAATADSAATLSSTLPINKGGTNATTAANARTNLGLSTAFIAASISGKVITLTEANGTTTTLTTQDTVNSFTGAVSQKSSKTPSTRTTWSITGLTAYKPLFIIAQNSTYAEYYCRLSVYSGSAHNDSNWNDKTRQPYLLGGTNSNTSSNNIVIIPTGTSVTISFGEVGGSLTLYAFQ